MRRHTDYDHLENHMALPMRRDEERDAGPEPPEDSEAIWDAVHAMPKVWPETIIDEAITHLYVADRQSLATDDQIIMEHVRAALGLLQILKKGARGNA